jgi:hypothetical protein
VLTACAELAELWRVGVRAANGTLSGWRTIGTERAALEAAPAPLLRDAWPRVPRSSELSAEARRNITFTPPGLDPVALAAARAVAFVFERLGLGPDVAYDLFHALIRVLEDTLRCDYEAVQTCSRPRVALHHGVIVLAVYIFAVYAALSIFGLGLVVALLAPFFALALFYLCYGYAWTCVPMLPVCLWSDITTAVYAVFPLSLTVPSQLKRPTRECQGALDADAALCYELLRDGFTTFFDGSIPTYARCFVEQDYPPPECLLSCREAPFTYTSAADVAAWLLAELGGAPADAALEAARFLSRLADTEPFINALNRREAVFERQPGSSEISAHRICAFLSLYMLVPYVLVGFLLLAYTFALVAAAASSLFPLLLLVCQLFASVTTGDDGSSNEERDELG